MIRALSADRALVHILLIIFLLLPGAALAKVATVLSVSGTVSVERAGGRIGTLNKGSRLNAGDTVTTAQRSKARLKFIDGGLVTLRSHSRLVIEAFKYNKANLAGDSAVLNLLKGGMRAVTGAVGKRGNPDAYQAKNFAATIGIRGTEYVVRLCGIGEAGDCSDLDVPAKLRDASGKPLPGAYFTVVKNSITVSNNSGQWPFSKGQHGYVRDFNSKPIMLDRDPGLLLDYNLFSRISGLPDDDDICPECCLVR